MRTLGTMPKKKEKPGDYHKGVNLKKLWRR